MGGGLGTLYKGITGKESQTISNMDAFTNPLGESGRIADKLDKHMGIDALAGVQGAFDMETSKLLKERDRLLASMDNQDLEASKKVRQARTNQARRTGRSSTILST